MSEQKIAARLVLEGAKMGLPICIGYLPLGFAYGVLAVKNGVPAFWAIAMSTLVFAGAGQFIAAGMIGAGAPVISVVIANLMVNLRHILMSAALAPFVTPLSKTWRTVISLFQTDEIFAVSIHSLRSGAKPDVVRLMSCSLVAQSGWIIGTAMGAFSGGMVADVRPWGLDYALTAMFIALLVPICLERLQLIVAAVAALLSVVFNMLGCGRWSIIMATVLAASLGLWLSLRRDAKPALKKDNRHKAEASS